MDEIYKAVAEKYNTEPSEVQTEIQKRLDDTWKNEELLRDLFDRKPTVNEFIQHLACLVMKAM